MTTSLLARLLHGIGADVLTRDIARKEPWLGSRQAPPITQDFEQSPGQHHVPILVALSLLDANHHPRTIDVRCGEANGFRDSQARGVASGQDGAMFGVANTVE